MRRGFTLIELLVVVAVIAILAALAIPSFLEAQTRSKVAAAKANLRTAVGALEAYAVDYNNYPVMRPVVPDDPLGVLAQVQLRPLSTPISYITSTLSLRDPFGAIRERLRAPSFGAQPLPLNSPFPELNAPNGNQSILYYHYRSLAALYARPELSRRGVAVLSIGPDLRDSYGAYLPFSNSTVQSALNSAGIAHRIDVIYDPTNGTVSRGDIPAFTGVGGLPIFP